MERERGFTLVEMMVSLAIFLIIVASVFGLYIGATKYSAFMQAKTDILSTVGYIYDVYRPYFYGASTVYDPQNLALGDIFNLPNKMELQSVEFYTRVLDKDGVTPEDAWVLITSTTTGYYIKEYNSSTNTWDCVPQRRVIVYRKFADTSFGGSDIDERTPPTFQDWRDWEAAGDVQKQVITPVVGKLNGLSTVKIIYTPYSVNASGVNIKWRKVQVVFTVGIRKEIYSDDTCTSVASRYPVGLYPYTVVLSITSLNR